MGQRTSATWALLLSISFLIAPIALVAPIALRADDAEKLKAAVFPIGGNAPAGTRERVAFSFRAKLDEGNVFEPIPGPTMADLAGDKAISLQSTPAELQALAADEKPSVLIWGELSDTGGGGQVLKVKVLDLRDAGAQPRQIEKTVADPTELRFAVEQILETIKGVKAFEHPSETSVTDDPAARALWAKNPNLVPDPDFAQSGPWTALYMDQKYAAPLADAAPAVDKVCILRAPGEGSPPAANMLAMKLSRDCAENNGMACISDFIKIEPRTRYRLQFKYKSDGPSLHVFVKGYTLAPSAVGKGTERREIYKRQVPPSGATDGKWVTVVDDMNPRHTAWPVQFLRVDLYAYLSPGEVMFQDVQLKAVGAMTLDAGDDAMKPTPKE